MKAREFDPCPEIRRVKINRASIGGDGFGDTKRSGNPRGLAGAFGLLGNARFNLSHQPIRCGERIALHRLTRN